MKSVSDLAFVILVRKVATNLEKCTESRRFCNRCNFFDFESYKKSLETEKIITIPGETSKNELLTRKFENPVNIPTVQGLNLIISVEPIGSPSDY